MKLFYEMYSKVQLFEPYHHSILDTRQLVFDGDMKRKNIFIW